MHNTRQREIYRFREENIQKDWDILAVEEPLEISLITGPTAQMQKLSVTMRTPGNDAELALGFLFTEGIIYDSNQVVDVLPDPLDHNKISVQLRPDFLPEMGSMERNFYTTSSCGVCGKSSIDAVKTKCRIHVPDILPKVSPELLYRLPENLTASQEVFQSTGGLHASALFDASGKLMLLREDVGRHNALDKVIGRSFLDGLLPLNEYILLLSGRASFELVQKAMMAGIRTIAAIGAPSSLAVELAEKSGIFLAGFLKAGRVNIYHGAEQIQP